MNPESLSLADAASLIRSRTLSPVEYAEALFGVMDRIESRVQAWVTVDRENVLAEARRCEAEAREGKFRGPLHGVPIGIKDIFYTKGLRTTMGSVLFNDFVPDCDADAVTKLKQAGAIVFGKTVTTVFANLDPGPTRNPWNLAHTPGGSSSGSAAAVAARMCPAAIGSQTVGSVGRPAAFCGVASLVPAQRRIGLKNVFPLAWSLDHAGIFARSVGDVELMFDAMTDAALTRPSLEAAPYRAGASQATLSRRERDPFRIGLVRGFFYENATEEARFLNERFARQLSSAGFRVEEAQLPTIFDRQQTILRTLLRSETASIHERLFSEHANTYGPKLRALIEMGMLIDAQDYIRARRMRRRYQHEMAKLFENFDVLMTPPARGAAPKGIDTTGDPVMNGPWTLTDFPTMTLPHAVNAEGLPIGVQLTGPPLQEKLLLQAAKEIEAIAGFNEKPRL
jgi:aspartyl-tRNA(Asn)/glutamyl-tRNA(Gln) amidotransferase subunit A